MVAGSDLRQALLLRNNVPVDFAPFFGLKDGPQRASRFLRPGALLQYRGAKARGCLCVYFKVCSFSANYGCGEARRVHFSRGIKRKKADSLSLATTEPFVNPLLTMSQHLSLEMLQ